MYTDLLINKNNINVINCEKKINHVVFTSASTPRTSQFSGAAHPFVRQADYFVNNEIQLLL